MVWLVLPILPIFSHKPVQEVNIGKEMIKKAQGTRHKAQGRRRKAEGARRKAEGGRQKAQGTRRKARIF
ncbi:hypothetical protein A4R26_23815 [Niastella populi]|uniref:Uncharacterized protein n=1 Tax=Niastella populi TaxID=550983 RepID=A0A1V9FH77_9BACT|nr:hypothetical protein A4R26_23815 [Niastella populi]